MKFRHFRNKENLPVSTLAMVPLEEEGKTLVALTRAHTRDDVFSYAEGRRIASDRVLLGRNLQQFSMLHKTWALGCIQHLLRGHVAKVETEHIHMLIKDLRELFHSGRPANIACRPIIKRQKKEES